MSLKEAIIEAVTRMQGCKTMDLFGDEDVLGLLSTEIEMSLSEVVQILVNEGELVEVEYILPARDYRIKSFLLPKGTKVVMFKSQERARLQD